MRGRVTKETQSDWPAGHSNKTPTTQQPKKKKKNHKKNENLYLRHELEKATLTQQRIQSQNGGSL